MLGWLLCRCSLCPSWPAAVSVCAHECMSYYRPWCCLNCWVCHSLAYVELAGCFPPTSGCLAMQVAA